MSDLPRPIEFDQIQVGDTVRRDRTTVTGISVSESLTVVSRTMTFIYSGEQTGLGDVKGEPWTLLARPEPEPLVPTEPTLGVLKSSDGTTGIGIFRRMSEDLVVQHGSDQPDSGLVSRWDAEDIESFEPLSIQPVGTTAVPTDALTALLAVESSDADQARVSDAATRFALALIQQKREAGEQS